MFLVYLLVNSVRGHVVLSNISLYLWKMLYIRVQPIIVPHWLHYFRSYKQVGNEERCLRGCLLVATRRICGCHTGARVLRVADVVVALTYISFSCFCCSVLVRCLTAAFAFCFYATVKQWNAILLLQQLLLPRCFSCCCRSYRHITQHLDVLLAASHSHNVWPCLPRLPAWNLWI